jgi:lipopolysaccharide export system permease protein
LLPAVVGGASERSMARVRTASSAPHVGSERMILQRYILREVVQACLMSLVVFVGVILALFLAELLGDAAQGQLPTGSVFWLLALRIPEALLLVGPLALMVGVLMGLGRLGESSELAVQRASGLAFSAVLAPIVLLAVLWSAGLLAVSGWAGPAAYERSSALMIDLARTALVSGIRPGQFDRLDEGRITLYVGSIERETGDLSEVFVYFDDGPESEVLSAPRGRIWIDEGDQRPYLTLYQGRQLRHASALTSAKRRQIEFMRNDIRLPAPEVGGGQSEELRLRLPELLPLNSPERFHEWHWRWASPVAALLLALLAVPLAQAGPRQGRFGAVVLALVLYLVYTNLVHAALVWLERRELLSGPGLWPLHGLVLTGVVLLLARQWRRW